MNMPKNSPSKIAANRRYTEKAYTRVSIYISKDIYDTIKTHAKESDDSMNGYINRLIAEDMAKNGKPL